MTVRLLGVFLLVLSLVTGLVLWLNQGTYSDYSPAAGGKEVAAGGEIGGHFSLTNQQGQKVQDTDFRGTLMLVFFGFTHCPDICPTTLGTLSEVLERLGENAAQITPILITVDPERDTSARLKEYLANFHPAFVGLTGTQEQVDAAVKAYKAFAARQEPEDPAHADHYMMQHTGLIYVMDRNGKYLAHFSQEDSAETIEAALQPYLK